MKNQNNQNNQNSGFQEYILPISILIAAVLISGSLFYTSGATGNNQANTAGSVQDSYPSAEKVTEVTSEDHIKGNKNAPIKIVEFSDLECPFCQRFHSTMKKVVNEYDGQVAWVYRHFPLGGHVNAQPAAEASECVADIAGNDAFWSFVDEIFQNQSQLGSGLIETAAQNAGVSQSELQQCMDSDKFAQDVSDDKQNAAQAGGRGTPYSVIITEDGQHVPLNGAQPYSKISSIIDNLLNQ